MMKGKINQQPTKKKETKKIKHLKDKNPTFLGNNDLRMRNTVQTFKIVILHLGNRASNKNIFSKSHFLSTRNNTLAFFFPCQSSAIVLSEIILPKTIDKVKSPGKCYTSALLSRFLWINHPPSLEEVIPESHHPPACPQVFMGVVHKSW